MPIRAPSPPRALPTRMLCEQCCLENSPWGAWQSALGGLGHSVAVQFGGKVRNVAKSKTHNELYTPTPSNTNG